MANSRFKTWPHCSWVEKATKNKKAKRKTWHSIPVEALKKIAQTLRVTTDSLIFEEDELVPDADLALQFRAITNMEPDEQAVIKELLEGMIIKYEAQRWSSKVK